VKYVLFAEMLQKAILGDMDAVNEVLCLYEPLINYYSLIDGKYDEDCRQYIMEHLIKRISKFKI